MRLNFTLLFFLSYFTIDAQWTQLSEIPNPQANGRHHPITFSIGNSGYVLTGSAAGFGNDLDNVFQYDAETDTWTQLDDFPGGARSFAYGVSYGQYAFVGFGKSPDFNLPYFKDLWRFDSTNNTWEEMAECPSNNGRLHPAFVLVNDKIYVGLGNNEFGNTNDWWEYDITNNSWTQKRSFPGFARHHPFHFTIGDFAYVGLGHGSQGNPTIYRDFYRYDPARDTWRQLANFPSEGRVAGTQFSYDGHGYVLSGQGEDHENLDDGELWKYYPNTDSWEQLESHPGSGRWAPGSFVIEDQVYFTGGLSDDRIEGDLWSYQLSELTSTNELLTKQEKVTLEYAENFIRIRGWKNNDTQAIVCDVMGRPILSIQDGIIPTDDLHNGYYVLVFPDGNFKNESFTVVK